MFLTASLSSLHSIRQQDFRQQDRQRGYLGIERGCHQQVSCLASLPPPGAGPPDRTRHREVENGLCASHMGRRSKCRPSADFVVQGIVTEQLPPALAPALSPPTLTTGQLSFTVTGTEGAAYVVEATAELGPPQWRPVATNIAPFRYTAPAVAQPARFFRARPE